MSSPDETHREPASVHDDQAAKSGHTDDHGHDDHAHDVATEFIKEDSLQDKSLQVVAIAVACGLLFMMWIWWTAPISYTPEEEHHGIKAPADAKGGEPSRSDTAAPTPAP
jgi:hypothetical protein